MKPLLAWLSLLAAAVSWVTTALASWARNRPHRRLFRIPRRRDDSMVCRGAHLATPLSADPDGCDVPAEVPARGQTAFLALTVSATMPGHWRDPFIEVSRGARKYRQYFERGAAGRRYLNLSPLFDEIGASPVGRVRLRGRSIRWSRDAVLLVFEPPPVAGARVLVLAPHPDDAEIATFGMYSTARSWVVTITAGELGIADLSALAPSEPSPSRHAARLRVWDSLTIPQLGNVPRERCLNLAYPDAKLATLHRFAPRPARLACEDSLPRALLRAQNPASEFQAGDPSCTWRDLVTDLQRLLEIAQPDIVICPHPLVDAHPDHVFTTVALEQAVREGGYASLRCFLYVVHRQGANLHPFGPKTGVVSFPPWGEKEWIADSVYSHPLVPDAQLGKYFAVEAMHDMRRFSTAEPTALGHTLTAVRRELSAWFAGTGSPASSHLRRAPRPNEIYGVVSAQSLSALVERALRAAPIPRLDPDPSGRVRVV